ncbi:MAG: calcium-binding protein [Campylobacterota bacterium]|nr:calcium-binding protein [Campylobacterota bacterium]
MTNLNIAKLYLATNTTATAAQIDAAITDGSAATAVDALSGTALLNAIYQAAFGRDADDEGIAYWGSVSLTGDALVDAIMAGAAKYPADGALATTAASDATITATKSSVDASAVSVGFAATTLVTVTDTATATTATTTIATEVENANADDTATVVGQIVAMTTAIDALAGTAGNDTFVGANDGTTDTMNLGDTIAGGTGTDTVSMFVSDDVNLGAMTLNSVETVKVKNTDAATDIDATEWTNVENVHFYKDTVATAVSSLQNNVAIEITEQATTVALDVDFVGTAFDDGATLSLTLNDTDTTADGLTTPDGLLAVNTVTDSFATLAITSNGTANDLTLDLDDGADVTDTLTTITVSGSADLALAENDDELESLTTVSASTMTGGLTLDLSADAQSTGTATAITVETGSGDDVIATTNNGDTVDTGAGDDTINGGAGNDTLSGGAGDDTITLAAGTDTVDAGAGDDTIVVAGNLAAGDSIDAGEGTDILSMTSALFAANDGSTSAAVAVRATATNYEAIMISDAYAPGTSTDISDYGVNHLILTTDITGAEAVDGFTSGATVEIRKATAAAESEILTVTMTGATGAGTDNDTLNIAFNSDLEDKDGVTDANVFAIDGINIINVTTADSATTGESIAAGTAPLQDDGYTLTTGTDANLITLNISGDYALTYTLANTATALATIDGSTANGDLTLDLNLFAGNQGLVVTTGAGDDLVDGSEDLADIISLGAGDDTYQMTTFVGTGSGADQIDLGTGADTVEIDETLGSIETAMISITNFDAVLSATEADTLDVIDATAEVIQDITAANGVDVSAADADSTAIANSIVAIVTDGIVTLDGADASKIDTLAEWIDVMEIDGVMTSDENNENVTGAFSFDGNTYVVDRSGTGGDTNTDVTDNIVELVDVTGVVAVDTTAAANTILIA